MEKQPKASQALHLQACFLNPHPRNLSLLGMFQKGFLYRILASGSYFEKGSGLPVPGVDKAKAEDMMKMMSGKSGELGWVPMGYY